jgi:hypothetical protein
MFSGMRRFAALLALPLLASPLAGCFDTTACDLSLQYGLSVRVQTADNRELCDATVVAIDGDYREELETFGGGDCVFVGAPERAGTYRIEVSRRGYEPRVIENVEVGEGECHVDAQAVNATLPLREGCDPVGTPAIEVIVRDNSGARACGATVLAAEQIPNATPIFEALTEADVDGGCGFILADRTGTFDVSITQGSETISQAVTVTADDCHLATQRLDVSVP